ncbi:LOW QUALITY PROTEIN: hypothetical protein AAY473_039659 [Plecturocebus cupreus]
MGEWKRRHFQVHIMKGLHRTRTKPLRFDENPTAFLERLRGALVKYIPLSASSLEEQLILKDKFVTREVPDEETVETGPGTRFTLVNLPKEATLVFCNRDGKAQEREKKHRKGTEALMAIM